MLSLWISIWLRALLLAFAFHAASAHAAQLDIVGPTGSEQFGRQVTVLPNGNFVVTDSSFDAPGPVADVGAVYLYSPTGTLISTLTGSTANDQVGNGGVTVLANGHYVIRSTAWSGSRGAVTWGSASTGVSGTVDASNSLVGGTASDLIGGTAVVALSNGNYVVRSPNWDAPGPPVVTNVGAVTWGNGTGGTVGLVSAANSLVGGTAGDVIGTGVVALSNGNYVVRSPNWDATGPAVTDVGAVTWGNGAGGTVGLVSAANSLVGGTASDQVGVGGVVALSNGNYVVSSSTWDAPGPVVDVGAATWGNGTGGTVGLVSAANSLVGGTANNQVGVGGAVTALSNGNYVVSSRLWDAPGPPAVTNVGAATWGNGMGGTVGLVSAANSLVGGTANDQVGVGGVTALNNGNYVVVSQTWDGPGPVTDVGAATWGNGAGGTVGLVSAANSLVGGTAGDGVGGGGVTALSNGNYVVSSRLWDAPGRR